VYGWDNGNRITSMTSPDGSTTYQYDMDAQLKVADHSYQSDEFYTYDYNGNRTSGGFIPPAPNGGANRLLEDSQYTYRYDFEGNRTRRTKKSDGSYEEYTWDHRNRLTRVATYTAGGTLLEDATYKYDPFDRRIGKTVDWDGSGPQTPITTRFVYDGVHIALQFDGAGSLTNRYLHGPAWDMVLADEYFSGGVSQGIRWALTDHLGTVRDLVDNSGAVVKHLKYDSFGNRTSDSAPSVAHVFAFTGKEWDAETGQYWYFSRPYGAREGSFAAEDGWGLWADANPYRYVGNSPTLATDPTGHQQAPARPAPQPRTNPTPPRQGGGSVQPSSGGINPPESAPPPPTVYLPPTHPHSAWRDDVLGYAEMVWEAKGRQQGRAADLQRRYPVLSRAEIERILSTPVASAGRLKGDPWDEMCRDAATRKAREKFSEAPAPQPAAAGAGKRGGKGAYKDVGGHHIHAQAGFKDHPTYDPEKGFSISQEYMRSRGWDHIAMTRKQRELFDSLARSGKANTLWEHTQIAIAALMEGGATPEEAVELVIASLCNFLEQGVLEPTGIPWNQR
jgi:RHS repeat-associated protein